MSGSQCRYEFVDGQVGTADQAPERTLGDFVVIGDGQGRRVVRMHQDDVAGALPRNGPAQPLKALTASRPLTTGNAAITQ
jgi:hypothetical protein